MCSGDSGLLVLGIGNVLMGDEGIGVHVVRRLQGTRLPLGVSCLDGGTGSFQLLEPLSRVSLVVMIDATVDEAPPGTLKEMCPRFSSDYPRTLTAHDIGLKDLLDVLYLAGEAPAVTLFTISIEPPDGVDLRLSPALAGQLESLTHRVRSRVLQISAARRVPAR